MSDTEDKSNIGDSLSSGGPTITSGQDDVDSDIPHLEEQEQELGNGTELRVTDHRRDLLEKEANASEVSSIDASLVDSLPRRAGSPVESVTSGRGDSIQGSYMSSPGSSVLPSVASRPGLNSPSPSFRPFDRRFQSRISSSSSNTPRPLSPAFLNTHSRNVSLSSNFLFEQNETDTPSPPWDVVRWTRLKKLNGQAFSEAGRRNFGSPTTLAVSAHIVLGTSKGIILIFDFNQNLKMIMGPGTKAVESGAITAIAVSADHTTVAGGHINGNIFTWDTSRPSRPFLAISHLDEIQAENRTTDGHVPNAAIVHLGFLGTRHTALVSADDRGMAFSHLATRGTGALGRTVKTTRILGRYPNAPAPAGKSIKPSTVLGFAPLPLGNVEQATDGMGLTALLTPYLLVIVSTTPIAQTQHKSARPKDVPAHSAMTGCLAWFPAVKLKTPDAHTGNNISGVKLVYCWSNVLTVLDVEDICSEDADQPASLKFKARSRWTCEEAIAAVQWLSRSVLAVLTISQRLIILEDRSMRMTEAFDLLQKHIYHKDLFSKQLHTLVEQLDETDVTMHGVVADAFYMSFKAYKGRVFLLGFNEISIGALSNWADRLIAMMENGDYIGAIKLATSYYVGDADKLTVGLPEDAALRHAMVQDKIMEIMSASLKYVFTQRQKRGKQDDDADHLRELAETCFSACQAITAHDFLFEDMYEWYSDGNVGGLFLETLEPYILEATITIVPPVVVKDMVNHYVTRGWEARLEEMICHMQTVTLDLDQITGLCKKHSLYDALTYVWNQALHDYITPMIDLLSLLVPLMTNGTNTGCTTEDDYFSVNALKIFPYLSYTLTGRVYPSGDLMDEQTADKAKAEIYWFFFSGTTIEWPRGSRKQFITRPGGESEAAFPYLRMILKFDAPSFLSALNEAFEDSFLNDSPDNRVNGGSRIDMPEEQIFGMSINRQYVVSILLDVMNPDEFAPEDAIYLDMFIARNLPKFQQYLLFSGSTLSKILTGLCHYPGEDLAEDAQLSAEYLLSVYQPSDMSSFMPLFKEAGFYRILKRVFRVEGDYGNLIATYFDDPEDREAVFECIADCLRPQRGLDVRQTDRIHQVIERHARDLLDISPEKTAQTLARQPSAVHEHIVDSAEDDAALQHSYLRALIEPRILVDEDGDRTEQELVERYIQLMCKYNPSHVSEFVEAIRPADLRLEKLLPTMEENGVVDAAVVLMARDGQINSAMDRLIQHLFTLESALQGLLTQVNDSANDVDAGSSTVEVLKGLQKYVHVGIWLCQGQTKTSKKMNGVKKGKALAKDSLSTDEVLWLSLIDACVQITKRLSPIILEQVEGSNREDDKSLALLRSLVQHTFTSLLTATSSQNRIQAGSNLLSNAGSNLSFLRILRAFLTNAAASSPNVADLRNVLSSIFAAYAYEESILRLSNRLLEKNLFINVNQSIQLRQRGWRPRGSTCEACSRRVWGPGVAGGSVFEAWEDKQAAEDGLRKQKKMKIAEEARGKAGESDGKDKGKSLDVRPSNTFHESDAMAGGKEAALGRLVVLACRHIYHQSCLDSLQERQENGVGGREREYKCPIDG
ncbi:golgi complex component [Metarhizium rileyi]|uniref:Golgi complex component n=1 Tax=Metarhizium rileyi (strain RCEF 4871) TaxID=1649241 RepID=A0A167GNZ5_METRR|nr:golgi complex component [Metarhizium rileyi RCEF 4871]